MPARDHLHVHVDPDEFALGELRADPGREPARPDRGDRHARRAQTDRARSPRLAPAPQGRRYAFRRS